MEFKKGELIKPKGVNSTTGLVIFTNGVTECEANQETCEAYGYTWDKSTDSCRAFSSTGFLNLMMSTVKIGNTIAGLRNDIKEGSFYNEINGTDNIIETAVQNSIITGRLNTIETEINNASVSGLQAKALRQGEIIQGGGSCYEDDSRGYFQASQIQLVAKTTEEAPTEAKVMGTGDIVIQTNSILGFELLMTVLIDSGAQIGDYHYFKLEGAIFTDDAKEATICVGDLETICMVGDMAEPAVELVQAGIGDDVTLLVSGLVATDIIWHGVMKLHETRTQNTL